MVAVCIHLGIGNHIRFGCVSQFLYIHLVNNMAGFRSNRPAAFENTFNTRDRFITNSGFISYPADPLDKYPEGMGAAFIHKSAGHDHVILEMAGQKPVIRMNIRLGPDRTESVSTTKRIERKNTVDQFHASAREP